MLRACSSCVPIQCRNDMDGSAAKDACSRRNDKKRSTSQLGKCASTDDGTAGRAPSVMTTASASYFTRAAPTIETDQPTREEDCMRQSASPCTMVAALCCCRPSVTSVKAAVKSPSALYSLAGRCE